MSDENNEMKESFLQENDSGADSNEQNESHKIDIQKCMTGVLQKVIIPIFFSTLANLLSYLLIGLTICFDSLRIYCLIAGNFHLYTLT